MAPSFVTVLRSGLWACTLLILPIAVEVSAAVDSHVSNANVVQAELERDTLPRLAHKYGFEFSFEGRSADQRETLADMKSGLVLGLGLIYLVLVWSFSSWSWPLVVMSAIPLGLAGAIHAVVA